MDNFISFSPLGANTSQSRYFISDEKFKINSSKKNENKDSFVLNPDTNKNELNLSNTNR